MQTFRRVEVLKHIGILAFRERFLLFVFGFLLFPNVGLMSERERGRVCELFSPEKDFSVSLGIANTEPHTAHNKTIVIIFELNKEAIPLL